MVKPLSLSQQQHLASLVAVMKAQQQAMQSEIDRFLDYLRDELGAPITQGWVLQDLQVGFVLPTPPQPPAPPNGSGENG